MSTKGPSKDVHGLGGFMEAVMALMVVTMAVIFLSTSLSYTGIQVMMEGDEDNSKGFANELTKTLEKDIMVWDGDFLVLSAFEARCERPYALPDGASGFRLELSLTIDTEYPHVTMSGGIEVDGAEVHYSRSPVAVKLHSGEVVPGILEMEVW